MGCVFDYVIDGVCSLISLKGLVGGGARGRGGEEGGTGEGGRGKGFGW